MCPYKGKKIAASQMDWLLKKGDNLATSEVSHA